MNLKRASEVGAVGHAVRRAMYRTLSLDRYLKTLSGMYLLGYRTGIGRSAALRLPLRNYPFVFYASYFMLSFEFFRQIAFFC